MPIPQSFIKNIALEINSEYEFKNIPISIIKDINDKRKVYNNFIGRKLHIEKFLSFLSGNSKNDSGRNQKKGVFLVTGYRGMGKTSFVNHVINKYRVSLNSHADKVIPITITLAQNEPKEIDILRLMTTSVFNRYVEYTESNPRKGYSEKKSKKIQRAWRFGAIVSAILFALAVSVFLKSESIPGFIAVSNGGLNILPAKAFDTIKIVTLVMLFLSLGFFFLSFSIYHVLRIREQNKKEEHDNAYNCIKWLVERCHSVIFEENQNFSDMGVQNLNTSFLSTHEKRNKEYPIASSKEIENELSRFLDIAAKDHELEFIFIFDELDKVDPALSKSYLYDDADIGDSQKSDGFWQRDLRNRKQAIINIIAGQKNFLTTANARFIFIAGHEMFDASLADIADRQSSISSIFTYIFNIESLLREFIIQVGSNESNNPGYNTNYSSLSFAIEEYLKKALFSDDWQSNSESLYRLVLKRYKENSNNTDPLKPNELAKIYITLQNFVIYLTYRSNGSPKKLIREIQEFIRSLTEREIHHFKAKGIVGKWQTEGSPNDKPSNFLVFNYYEQYRLEFINYIYRPFLINNGRNFKHYSDNIIVSTPYLFDHLMKFHPFAFSHTNLELIPEVLSTSKTPSLKEHIKQIIDYLSNNHIRETEIGLFDYKFYSRTLNELSFISKKFEKESAAFNFTLDESYLVKLDIRSKIKEARAIYSDLPGSRGEESKLIFSIAHLNGMLGDLHFFDQEFNDSIVAYSDAISPITGLELEKMSIRDFITLIRNKLKIGLCYEKINSFEDSLAFYSDCCEDSKKFILNRLNVSRPVWKLKSNTELIPQSEKAEFFDNSSISDLLEIVNQAFIAKIIIQEKLGIEGISTPKISIALGGFLNIAEFVAVQCGKNYVVCANAYLLTGKALYFKNSPAATHAGDKYYKNYPVNAGDNLQALRTRFTILLGSDSERHPRKPLLSLCFYILGLQEILSSRDINYNGMKFPDILKVALTRKDSTIISNFLGPLKHLLSVNDESFTGIHYRYIAIFLSNIGDCLLSSLSITDNKESNYRHINLDTIFDTQQVERLVEKPVDKRLTEDIKFSHFLKGTDDEIITIADVLHYFYLSGEFFKKYGRLASCSFQLRKILHLLSLVSRCDAANKKFKEGFFILLQKTIVEPVIDIGNANIGNSNIHIENKARSVLAGICEPEANYIKNNVFRHPEIIEAKLMYNMVRLKLGMEITPSIDKIITSENTITTQFARILELHFHTTCLYRTVLEPQLIPLLKKNEHPQVADTSLIPVHENEELIGKISDYLFNMFSMLRVLKIYGSDYLMGFSFIAFKHFRIGCLLKQINESTGKEMIMEKVRKDLEFNFGEKMFGSFDHQYHLQIAKSYFHKTIQLHTTGNEYKKAVNEMVYLEDDFNDNAYHFGAAYDRYLMVNGVFESRIRECERLIAE